MPEQVEIGRIAYVAESRAMLPREGAEHEEGQLSSSGAFGKVDEGFAVNER